MKRLALHIVLFILPVLGLVLFFPQKRERVYAGLKNDCAGRGDWMYQRLYQNPAPVDIAFIGSSKTMNSIDDSLLQESLPGFHVLNFGYCRYGRNLHYHFIEELIAEKGIDFLILEVRDRENPYSHPMFPYVATHEDLFKAYPLFNKDWLSDWSTAFRYRLQLAQERLWHEETPAPARPQKFGYTPNDATANGHELAERKRRRSLPSPQLQAKKTLDHLYPIHYLEKIVSLCEENKVKLFFLYLPNYGLPRSRPQEAGFYRQHGTLLLTPQHILKNPVNWSDPDHLNAEGASQVSHWLSAELKETLRGEIRLPR